MIYVVIKKSRICLCLVSVCTRHSLEITSVHRILRGDPVLSSGGGKMVLLLPQAGPPMGP